MVCVEGIAAVNHEIDKFLGSLWGGRVVRCWTFGDVDEGGGCAVDGGGRVLVHALADGVQVWKGRRVAKV